MSPTRFLFFWLALILAVGGATAASPASAQAPAPLPLTATLTPTPSSPKAAETPTPGAPPATAEIPAETPSPTATEPPTPTPSPTATEISIPSPSPAVTETPTAAPPPIAPPTPAPALPPTATPSGGLVISLPPSLPQPVLLLGGLGCGVVLLVVLGLLVGLLLRRRTSTRRLPTLPAPAQPSPPRLEARVAGRPRLFPLQKETVTIGRAPDNDLVVSSEFSGWETVSRHHARIYRQGNLWIVEDLRSTNGIYVNGKRTGRNLLREGWRLEIGGVAFIFHEGQGGAA